MQGNNRYSVIRWLAGLRNGIARQVDLYAFDCKVELSGQLHDGREIDAFEVQMRGRIHTPADNYDTNVQVQIQDITEGRTRPLAILCTDSRWQQGAQEPVFRLIARNGIVPKKNAVLAKWKAIACIGTDVLRFPHRGQRRLLFEASILSNTDGTTLAATQTTFDYFVAADEGYVDFQERQKRIIAACVELAVAAAGFKPEDVHKSVIADWIDRQGKGSISGIDEFEKEMNGPGKDRTIAGEKIALLCATITEQAAADWRLQAAELCIRIAAACPPAPSQQMDFIWSLGQKLQIEPQRMRIMLDKILPMHLQQTPNLKILLGVDDNMSAEDVHQLLTSQYRKWNARVNHPDEAVRQQADMMLSFLAQAKNTYANSES